MGHSFPVLLLLVFFGKMYHILARYAINIFNVAKLSFYHPFRDNLFIQNFTKNEDATKINHVTESML